MRSDATGLQHRGFVNLTERLCQLHHSKGQERGEKMSLWKLLWLKNNLVIKEVIINFEVEEQKVGDHNEGYFDRMILTVIMNWADFYITSRVSSSDSESSAFIRIP